MAAGSSRSPSADPTDDDADRRSAIQAQGSAHSWGSLARREYPGRSVVAPNDASVNAWGRRPLGALLVHHALCQRGRQFGGMIKAHLLVTSPEASARIGGVR